MTTKSNAIKNTDFSTTLFINILATLIFLGFFEESVKQPFSMLAFGSVLLVPIVIFLWIVIKCRTVNYAQWVGVLASSVLFAFVQILCIRNWRDYEALTPIYRTISLFFMAILVPSVEWKKVNYNYIVFLLVISNILGLISVFNLIPKAENGYLLFGNPNTIGVVYFTLIFVTLKIRRHMKKWMMVLLILSSLAVIWFSTTRTALFCIGLLVIFILFVKLVNRKKLATRFWLISCMLLIGTAVTVYYFIKDMPFYDFLNNLSQKLFGKNFDSGRPDLWHYAVDAVGENIWFGCGSGYKLESFMPGLKTSHSVFFETYMQFGIFGLAAFCIMIFSLFRIKGKNVASDFDNLWILGIFIIIILYNAVGIVITKNRSTVGLLQWFLLALPFGANKKTNEEGAKS